MFPSLPLPLVLLGLVSSIGAQQYGPMPDPYKDPANDPYNPLRYIANNALTAVAFSLIVAVGFLQTACIYKWGARWMLAMTIGCYTFAAGLGLRFGLNIDPHSKGIYIAEYLFVVLSPCAFIAATYVLLGRIALHLESPEFLLISAKRITWTFIGSDITTFLIQAAGGGMSISWKNTELALAGSRVFLAGLALQLLSFTIFTIVYLAFLFRLYTRKPETWRKDAHLKWYNDWRALALALFVSCIGILIRSLYRTIELSEGFGGKLTRSEPFFYGLDTLPLFIAIVVFVPFWPGRFISEPVKLDSPTGSVGETSEIKEERPLSV